MGVLDNCGSYSDRLSQIAEDIYKIRLEKGEKAVDKDRIDLDVYEGYQAVLENANDGQDIAEAINELARKTSNGNIAVNFKAMAAETTINIREKNEEARRYAESTLKTFGTVAGAIVATEAVMQLSTADHLKEVDNTFETTFSPDVKEKIDERLEQAKNGDKKAIISLDLIKRAGKFFASNPKLDVRSERGALAWMMQLAQIDNPEAKKLLEEMAKKYKMNIFDRDENEKTVVSKEKLEDLFEEKISEVNPKLAKKRDFSDIMERRAQISIERGDYSKDKKSDDFINDMKEGAREGAIRKRLNIALKNNDVETIKEISETAPELFNKELKTRAEAYNKLMERNPNSDKNNKVYNQVQMLNEVAKQRNKEKPSFEVDRELEI